MELLEQKKEKLDFKRRQLDELAKRVAVREKEGIKVSVETCGDFSLIYSVFTFSSAVLAKPKCESLVILAFA